MLHVPDTELDAFISHLTQQNPPMRNPRLGAIRALPTHSRQVVKAGLQARPGTLFLGGFLRHPLVSRWPLIGDDDAIL